MAAPLILLTSSSPSAGLLLVTGEWVLLVVRLTPFPGLGHPLPPEFVIGRNACLLGDTVEEQWVSKGLVTRDSLEWSRPTTTSWRSITVGLRPVGKLSLLQLVPESFLETVGSRSWGEGPRAGLHRDRKKPATVRSMCSLSYLASRTAGRRSSQCSFISYNFPYLGTIVDYGSDKG